VCPEMLLLLIVRDRHEGLLATKSCVYVIMPP
jgi:hypothetical protein